VTKRGSPANVSPGAHFILFIYQRFGDPGIQGFRIQPVSAASASASASASIRVLPPFRTPEISYQSPNLHAGRRTTYVRLPAPRRPDPTEQTSVDLNHPRLYSLLTSLLTSLTTLHNIPSLLSCHNLTINTPYASLTHSPEHMPTRPHMSHL